MADEVTVNAGNLDRLMDVVVPEPVSWWPPAPGWWVVGAIFLIGVVVLVVWKGVRWRHDAYRRAACAELDRLGDQVEVDRVNEVLKRTALCAWPREEIAPLASEGWISFLSSSGPMSEESGRMLNLAYTSSVFRGAAGSELKAAAREWIEGHDAGRRVEESKSRRVKGVNMSQPILVLLLSFSLVTIASFEGTPPGKHAMAAELSPQPPAF